jgi:TetR/AcrR family transcriptional regulator, transcriptional repressor of bet genes
MPKVGMEPVRRAQIRKAAVKLISKRGFDGTTLLDVAIAARISTGTISHYYDSKVAMLVDALTYASETLQERMREAIEVEKSPSGKLRALIHVGIFDDAKDVVMCNAVWPWALAEALRLKEMRLVIEGRRRLFQTLLAEVIGGLDIGGRMSRPRLEEFCAECDAYFCGLRYHRLTGELNIDQQGVEDSFFSMALARCAADRPGERLASRRGFAGSLAEDTGPGLG